MTRSSCREAVSSGEARGSGLESCKLSSIRRVYPYSFRKESRHIEEHVFGDQEFSRFADLDFGLLEIPWVIQRRMPFPYPATKSLLRANGPNHSSLGYCYSCALIKGISLGFCSDTSAPRPDVCDARSTRPASASTSWSAASQAVRGAAELWARSVGSGSRSGVFMGR